MIVKPGVVQALLPSPGTVQLCLVLIANHAWGRHAVLLFFEQQK